MLPPDDVMQILEEAKGYSISVRFWKTNCASNNNGHSRQTFGFVEDRNSARDLTNPAHAFLCHR